MLASNEQLHHSKGLAMGSRLASVMFISPGFRMGHSHATESGG